MKQIKPVVVGYKKIEVDGAPVSFAGMTKKAAKWYSVKDLELFGVKSKFRPIYNGHEEFEEW